jgi:hypothetical protein
LRFRGFAGFAFGLAAFLGGLRTPFLAGFFLAGFFLDGFATVFFFGFGALRPGLAGFVLRDGFGLGIVFGFCRGLGAGFAGFGRLAGGEVFAGRFAGTALRFFMSERLRSVSSGPLATRVREWEALTVF